MQDCLAGWGEGARERFLQVVSGQIAPVWDVTLPLLAKTVSAGHIGDEARGATHAYCDQ